MTYAIHEIWLCDYWGRRLALLDDFISASMSRIVNGIGSCSVVLPHYYEETEFRIGYIIEYWRAPIGLSLQPEAIYILDGYVKSVDNSGIRTITVQGSHVNNILGWRVARNLSSSSPTSLTLPGDDMIKKLARDSMTVTAGSSRSLTPFYNFSVDNDVSDAPTHTREVVGVPVLETANNIASALATEATTPYWLYWDIVPTGFNYDFGLELRTYGGYADYGQRGRNRRPTSSNPIVLSIDNNTLAEVKYERRHDKEYTHLFTVGNGPSVLEYSDEIRAGLFPANRREKYATANKTGSAADAEARNILRDGRPIDRIIGKFAEHVSVRYGVEVLLGDALGLQLDERIRTVRAKAVSIGLKKGEETVDVNLEPIEITES